MTEIPPYEQKAFLNQLAHALRFAVQISADASILFALRKDFISNSKRLASPEDVLQASCLSNDPLTLRQICSSIDPIGFEPGTLPTKEKASFFHHLSGPMIEEMVKQGILGDACIWQMLCIAVRRNEADVWQALEAFDPTASPADRHFIEAVCACSDQQSQSLANWIMSQGRNPGIDWDKVHQNCTKADITKPLAALVASGNLDPGSLPATHHLQQFKIMSAKDVLSISAFDPSFHSSTGDLHA